MKAAFRYKWLICTLLTWAILFAVPTFRYHLKVMAEGSPWIRFTVLPNHYKAYDFPTTPDLPLPIKVRQAQTSNQNIAFTTSIDGLTEVDKLLSQHPNLPWLIATRLQIAIGAFSGNRQGGELSEANPTYDVKHGIPPIEKRKEKANFSPKQLQETLAFCRRGEKLEPQNAYFSWMRFYFLMLSWQDVPARKALREAASKTYWDNHAAEFDRIYAKAASDILGRRLTPFETVTFNAFPVEFSAPGRIREMGRIIGWEGVKLKRAGKHTEALELWADEYHAMTLAAQSESKIFPFLVDSAMLSMAAMGATYPSRETFRNGPRKKLSEEERMHGLFAYAEKYNRPDLAQQLERDWQKNHALLKRLKSSHLTDKSFYWLSVLQAGACLLTVSVLIILSVLGALLAWIFLKCYSILKRRKSTFEDIPISFLSRVKGIIACSGLPSFLFAMLLMMGLIFLLRIFIPQDLQNDIIGGWSIPDYSTFPFDSNIFVRMFTIFSNLTELYSFPASWRIYALLTPIIAGASFVLFQSSQTDTQNSSIWRKLGKWFYLALLFTAWGIPALTNEYDLPQIILTTICISFLLVSFVWMWRNSRNRSGYKLSLLQSSLSGWICAGSALVLIFIIGQVVLDQKLQPWADSQLRGEMHLLHHVVDAPPERQ